MQTIALSVQNFRLTSCQRDRVAGSQLLHTIAAPFKACRHRATVRRSLVLLRGLGLVLRLTLLLNSFVAAAEPSDQFFQICALRRPDACSESPMRHWSRVLRGSCHRSVVPPHRRASGSSTGNLNERRCGDAMLQHEQICVNPTTNDALSLFGSQRVQDR